MCGISGFFLKKGERAERGDLQRMADAMRRRGPDAEGFHISGGVGLAHRRLKVIDLSEAAAQPLFNEDGKVAVVFNGEIYNFLELRGQLEKLGHRFRSRSDTEVIVHAFEEWGMECFRRFNGMFALAILDERNGSRSLHLARDRFGIKPLFYSVAGGRLVFASELKPLLTLPWLEKKLDLGSVYRFLNFSHVPTPDSILKDVKQLEPCAWLSFNEGAVREGRYRDPLEASGAGLASGSPGGAPPAASVEDYLGELDRVLLSSVRRQIISDVPVGCFLSGGVDSSLLTIAYSELGQRSPVETYSIGYEDSEFDETPHARVIAKAFGTHHHEVIVGADDFVDLIPEVPEYFDQPFADPTLLSSLLLARFAKMGVTVALSGDGGDELFLGYPHQRAIMRLSGVSQVPTALRRGLLEPVRGSARILSRLGIGGKRVHQIGKLAEILQFADEAELCQYFVGIIGPQRTDRMVGLFQDTSEVGGAPYAELLRALKDLPPAARVEQVFMRTFLVDTVLAKTDRAGMAYGLEARVPFLDDEMVAFAARLPVELKYGKGQSKYLLRKLLKRKLDAAGISNELSRRPKQGFSIPLREWLREDLKYLLDEYLNSERISRDGIFVPAEVRRLVREHVQNYANHTHLLWSMVNFQMWKERYLD